MPYYTYVPVWDPAGAAPAAAAFAGILGALLLSVTLQIALNDKKPSAVPHQLHSLAVTPIALLLLLVSAYTYVVLSGTQAQEIHAAHCLQSPRCSGRSGQSVYLAYLRIPAAMFALGGSYLALGAVLVALGLSLVVSERETVQAARDATRVFSGWRFRGHVVCHLGLPRRD